VSSVFSRTLLQITDHRLPRWLFTEHQAGRSLALRFVAGETLDDAMRVASELNAAGMTVSLDHLGESVADVASARAARDGYLECLARIAAEGIDGNVSIKLTQLGLGLDKQLALAALREIAAEAAASGTTVTIDMEDGRYTQVTLDIYEEVQKEFGNLGVAVQAYLFRTAADIARVAPLGGHIRLCKGAYAEDESIAMTRKEHVDASFATLTRQLMDQGDARPAIATHDDRLIDLAHSLAVRRSRSCVF
jgi:proline dehydrogenase